METSCTSPCVFDISPPIILKIIFYMVQFLRKVSDSEQQQKEQLMQKINCSECDSFQLYQFAELQMGTVWG